MVFKNRAWLLVLFSMMFVGCYAMIAQVLIIREFIVVFFGNELCFGIILGTWLFGVASGAATGGRIVDRLREHVPVFTLVLVSMCVILPLELVLIRVLRYVLNVPAGQYIPILSLLFSSILIITPFSFTIGLIFPIACKVVRGFTRDSAVDIGSMYILESVGSLIGGLLFTFVLVSRFQPFAITLILDCVMFLNIYLILLLFKERFFKKGHSFACLLVFIVAFVLLVSGVVNKIDNYFINARWKSSNPDIKLLESIDSRYENIVIGVREDQYSVFGNGQYNFAFPDDYENSQIAHLIMTQHPSPERVLLIGGGMGGLMREMLKHSIDELHYIELDPVLIESTRKYLPTDEIEALSDKRVKIFHVDGRYFVKRAGKAGKYDLIFVNIPDPSTAFLNRFYTSEFFQEANDILEKEGVLATGVSSAVNYLGEDVGSYVGSVYQTMHSVFPHVIVSPGQTNYFFASNSFDTATFDIQTLVKRYVERGVQSEYFSEHVFQTLLPPGRVKFVADEIKSRKGLSVNTDTKPVTYFFNLMLWDKLTGSQLGSILKLFERSHLKIILIPIFMFLICRIVYIVVFRRSLDVQQRFNSIAVVATTGFAGMALEIILIYAFQNIYGYVYEKIGLIIAVFMFGLAMGGGLSNRMILQRTTAGEEGLPGNVGESKEKEWIKVLLVLESFVVVYALIMPPVLNQISFLFFNSEYPFMALVVITGVLTGIEFPIASKLYFLRKGEMGATAGALDSADHTGAFIGAILTGVLFVPIFGIMGSCVIIAGLNLMSLLFLIYHFSQKKYGVHHP